MPLRTCSIVFCLAGLGAGCVSTMEAIEGEDDSAFLPALRLSLPLGTPVVVLELDAARGSGAFEQSLAPGERVILDEVGFAGPGEIGVDFELDRVYCAARVAAEGENGLGVSGLMGLGLLRLDTSVEMRPLEAESDVDGVGFLVGVEGFYRVGAGLRLYAEVSLMPVVSGDAEGAALTAVDLGLAWAPWPQLELALGWRRWDYEVESNDAGPIGSGLGGDSDLDLTLSGLHAGLRFRL